MIQPTKKPDKDTPVPVEACTCEDCEAREPNVKGAAK